MLARSCSISGAMQIAELGEQQRLQWWQRYFAAARFTHLQALAVGGLHCFAVRPCSNAACSNAGWHCQPGGPGLAPQPSAARQQHTDRAALSLLLSTVIPDCSLPSATCSHDFKSNLLMLAHEYAPWPGMWQTTMRRQEARCLPSMSRLGQPLPPNNEAGTQHKYLCWDTGVSTCCPSWVALHDVKLQMQRMVLGVPVSTCHCCASLDLVFLGQAGCLARCNSAGWRESDQCRHVHS